MTIYDDLLEANRRFAERFTGAKLIAPPRRHLAVLTCMDARMDPAAFLALEPGDAHVIRNAGGRASDDALRSLALSAHLLGTRHVAVIQHRDCGLQTFTNDQMRRQLADQGVDAHDVDFLPITDLEASVRDDVARIRRSPLVPEHVTVAGFVYAVATGGLQPIDVPGR